MGSLTTTFALSFHNSGHLLKELNETLVTLIPKTKCPKRVSHYRPISLYNVAYKIISKVIVNRLQSIMSDIISLHQNAFIKGKSISDNIILDSELINTIMKKKRVRDLLELLNWTWIRLTIGLVGDSSKLSWNVWASIIIGST